MLGGKEERKRMLMSVERSMVVGKNKIKKEKKRITELEGHVHGGWAGVKDKCAVVNHSLGKIAHDWFGLGGEVTEHYIRLPATDELDNVGVHFGNE